MKPICQPLTTRHSILLVAAALLALSPACNVEDSATPPPPVVQDDMGMGGGDMIVEDMGGGGEACAPGQESCNGHGTCSDDGGVISCACEPGYTGRLCDTCQQGYEEMGQECVRVCPEGRAGADCGDCAEGWVELGDSCIIDPCAVDPCTEENQVAGSCQVTAQGEYQCDCDEGFEGRLCTEVNPCEPNPCQNGAQCAVDGATGMSQCICPAGFGGELCQECAPGHFGATCEACAKDCGTHGRCDEGLNGTGTCLCQMGWAGETCDMCAPGHYGAMCDVSCDAVSNAAWWDKAYQGRRAVLIQNTSATDAMEKGRTLTLALDHQALVTAGAAQADGSDLRIVYRGQEIDRVLRPGSSWNAASTELLVGLPEMLGPGEALVLWVYLANAAPQPQQQDLANILHPKDGWAYEVGAPDKFLFAPPLTGSFYSVQLRQISPKGIFEAVAWDRTSDSSAYGRLTITDSNTGLQIYNNIFKDFGTFHAPRTMTEPIRIPHGPFVVEMETREYSGTQQIFGGERVGFGSGVTGKTRRKYEFLKPEANTLDIVEECADQPQP